MTDLFDFTKEIESVEEDVNENTSYLNGLGAEYLVAADLCLSGHRCSFAAAGLPYDLIADVEGRLMRIQVKASSYARMVTVSRGKNRKTIKRDRYYFRTRREGGNSYDGHADVFAFVALDIKRVLYVRVKSACKFLLRPDLLTEDYCNLSREQVFK